MWNYVFVQQRLFWLAIVSASLGAALLWGVTSYFEDDEIKALKAGIKLQKKVDKLEAQKKALKKL